MPLARHGSRGHKEHPLRPDPIGEFGGDVFEEFAQSGLGDAVNQADGVRC